MTASLVTPKQLTIATSSSTYTPVIQLSNLLSGLEDVWVEQTTVEFDPSPEADKNEAILFITLADLRDVVKLTRSFVEQYTKAERLIWVAPAFPEQSNFGNILAEAEAIVTDCQQQTLVVRHAPLIDELRNNKEIKFRRSLSLPLGDDALPWLSSQDLVDRIHNWLQGEEDSTVINLTGKNQLTGSDLATEISQALERNLDSRRFALRRFEAIDRDRSGELDSEEMLGYLLELGYGAEEAKAIVEEADTNKDGAIDFGEFIEGLGEHLEKILKDVPRQVQYINVPRATALYDLISKGTDETTAHCWLDWLSAIQEFGLPSSGLDRDTTSITDWLEQHVLDFINVYILPGRGVLTISEGVFEGKPALVTKLLQSGVVACHQRSYRVLQGIRTLDNKAVEWQIFGEDSGDLEIVRHELSKGGERVLKLKDSQLVGLSVRGLWTGRRWATELFFKHQPLPRWQINLFRELGELQIEETSSLIEPEGVVCNKTRIVFFQARRRRQGTRSDAETSRSSVGRGCNSR